MERRGFDFQSVGQFFITIVFIIVLANNGQKFDIQEFRRIIKEENAKLDKTKEEKIIQLEVKNQLLILEIEAHKEKQKALEQELVNNVKRNGSNKRSFKILKGAVQNLPLNNSSVAGGDGSAAN